ncbi:hypothetical protein FMM68_11195 [Lachnospiraceae bacterium MD329]|nr:hypothetical protein [Lachnospiraceae bacterium MD329]
MQGYYVGRVSNIDTEKGYVKVTYPEYDNTVSEWLPLLAFEYQMPEIGALVATFLDDERGNGICFGKIYSNEQKPPANVGYKKIVDGMEITKKDNVFSVKFDDNNYIRFSGGTMTIKADKVNIIDNTEG